MVMASAKAIVLLMVLGGLLVGCASATGGPGRSSSTPVPIPPTALSPNDARPDPMLARWARRADPVIAGQDYDYVLGRYWWSSRLDLSHLARSSNTFGRRDLLVPHLFITVAVTNRTDGPLSLPRMWMVDERGRRFEPIDTGWADGAFFPFARVNPDGHCVGTLMFDVSDAPDEGYTLIFGEGGGDVAVPILRPAACRGGS